MALDKGLQDLLRQYDNNETSWGGKHNTDLLERIQQYIENNWNEHYIHSASFTKDMQEFSQSMYTKAQLYSYPAPFPDRICKNAVRNLRHRVILQR